MRITYPPNSHIFSYIYDPSSVPSTASDGGPGLLLNDYSEPDDFKYDCSSLNPSVCGLISNYDDESHWSTNLYLELSAMRSKLVESTFQGTPQQRNSEPQISSNDTTGVFKPTEETGNGTKRGWSDDIETWNTGGNANSHGPLSKMPKLTREDDKLKNPSFSNSSNDFLKKTNKRGPESDARDVSSRKRHVDDPEEFSFPKQFKRQQVWRCSPTNSQTNSPVISPSEPLSNSLSRSCLLKDSSSFDMKAIECLVGKTNLNVATELESPLDSKKPMRELRSYYLKDSRAMICDSTSDEELSDPSHELEKFRQKQRWQSYSYFDSVIDSDSEENSEGLILERESLDLSDIEPALGFDLPNSAGDGFLDEFQAKEVKREKVLYGDAVSRRPSANKFNDHTILNEEKVGHFLKQFLATDNSISPLPTTAATTKQTGSDLAPDNKESKSDKDFNMNLHVGIIQIYIPFDGHYGAGQGGGAYDNVAPPDTFIANDILNNYLHDPNSLPAQTVHNHPAQPTHPYILQTTAFTPHQNQAAFAVLGAHTANHYNRPPVAPIPAPPIVQPIFAQPKKQFLSNENVRSIHDAYMGALDICNITDTYARELAAKDTNLKWDVLVDWAYDVTVFALRHSGNYAIECEWGGISKMKADLKMYLTGVFLFGVYEINKSSEDSWGMEDMAEEFIKGFVDRFENLNFPEVAERLEKYGCYPFCEKIPMNIIFELPVRSEIPANAHATPIDATPRVFDVELHAVTTELPGTVLPNQMNTKSRRIKVPVSNPFNSPENSTVELFMSSGRRKNVKAQFLNEIKHTDESEDFPFEEKQA